MQKRVVALVLSLLVVLGCLLLWRAFIRRPVSSADTPSGRGVPIHLENANLAVAIDRNGGQIVELHNRLTDERHTVVSHEFAVVSRSGTTPSDEMTVTRVAETENHVVFHMEGGGCRAELHYELGTAWVEKWVTFTSDEPLHLERVVMGRREFQPAFNEIHFHTDNTIYDVPVNCFLRTDGGGWYAGIAWPFTEAQGGPDGLTLAYGGWRLLYKKAKDGAIDTKDPYKAELADINVMLPAGAAFVTEKEFLGVYEATGYRREKEVLGTPRTIITAPEVLDWGEVWAMQAYMQHVLPLLPATHEGFWYYFNEWWAGGPKGVITEEQVQAHMSVVDRAKELGAEAFGLAPFWLGMSRYNEQDSPFLHTVGQDGKLKLSPAAQAVVNHIESRGMSCFASSEGSSHYREDRPDWKRVGPGGKPTGQLCWAHPEATEWFFALHSAAMADHAPVRFWIWDGGWLPRRPASWECMATNHGHPPGNIAYQSYTNVLEGLHALRQEHPHVGLGFCWAAKAGGPWVLRDVDITENFHENRGPDDLRFQHWYMLNSSFVPPYKHMSQIWIPSRDYGYGWMSALASGSDIGFIVELPAFNTGEKKQAYLDFTTRWRDWASKNIERLRAKRSLFGQPLREGGIDGSAHIIGDRGFLFVFNPTRNRHIGSIPLNELIGLTSGKRFDTRVLYPETGGLLGTYHYGDKLLVEVKAGACTLIEVLPSEGTALPKVVPTGADIQPAFK